MSLPNYAPPPLSFEPQATYKEWLQGLTTGLGKLFQYIYDYFNQSVLPAVNTIMTGFGADIPAEPVITVSSMIHQVVNSAGIETIQLPANSIAVGPLMLFARDGFTIVLGGNCTPALSVPAGHGALLVYHPAIGLWVGITT